MSTSVCEFVRSLDVLFADFAVPIATQISRTASGRSLWALVNIRECAFEIVLLKRCVACPSVCDVALTSVLAQNPLSAHFSNAM